MPRMLIVTCLLSLVCSGAGVAAEERVRSLQYIESSGPVAAGPDYVAQVMILDGCVRRMSIKKRPTEGFTTAEPAAPDLHDFYEIYNAKTGKRVYVYPEKREFVLVKGVRTNVGGDVRVDAVKPDPTMDFDQPFRRPISGNIAQELPERIVDGRRAIGLLVDDSSGGNTRTTTYWVDPKTRLPIRIEDRFQPADRKQDGSVSIRRNIVFDEPLDKSLFSTEPPQGYKVLPDADE